MTARKILLLHGIGGIADLPPALDLINDHLAARGYPRIDRSDVIDVDYDWILEGKGRDGGRLESTWRRPDSEVHAHARREYVSRAARIRARVDRLEAHRGGPLRGVPESLGGAGGSVPAKVDRYASSRSVRDGVRRKILSNLPASGEIIIVGHSLGSVIAADLIDHLPPKVTVRALITLASPLGFVPRLREHSRLMRDRDGFPFSRVGAWTNIYSATDWVTGGRGIAHRYCWATDVSIDAASHGLRDHLNHPVTLHVLEEALYATYLPAVVAAEVDRSLADEWVPQLLAFAWAQAVGDSLPSGEEGLRRRLRAARWELATRSVADYRDQIARLDQQQAQAGDLTSVDIARLDLLRNHPSEAELVDHAGELLSGRLPDEALLLWLVPVIRAWPVAPYGTAADLSWDTRQRALEVLLAGVRRRGRGRRLPSSHAELARMVVDHVRQATRDMGQEQNGAAPWWLVAGVGALAVAAVPFTFGASIPAGLTGAAAMTAGLAAFGPGGMAAGIATIAMMTGAGTLAAGAGAAMAHAENGDHGRRLRDRRMANDARHLRDQLTELPSSSLVEALITTLAVIRLEEELGGAVRADRYAMCRLALDRMRTDLRLHEEFGPGSAAAKEQAKRVRLMERFAEHVRPDEPQVSRQSDPGRSAITAAATSETSEW